MKGKKTSKWWFVLVLIIGLVIGYIAHVSNNCQQPQTSQVQFVPKDLYTIKLTDVKWKTEPYIRCNDPINYTVIRNGTIFLSFGEMSKLRTTEESVVFAPSYVRAYPDIYPSEVVYVNKDTGDRLTADNICHVGYSVLQMRKVVMQKEVVITDEIVTCEIDLYGNMGLQPEFTERQVNDCIGRWINL